MGGGLGRGELRELQAPVSEMEVCGGELGGVRGRWAGLCEGSWQEERARTCKSSRRKIAARRRLVYSQVSIMLRLPEAVLRAVLEWLASPMEPDEVHSCLSTAACEPVDEPEKTKVGYLRYKRSPKRAHFMQVMARLEELDVLARACRQFYKLCWSAPIAAKLPTSSDVLRVLCRLGLSRAYRTVLPLHDPTSQLLQQDCDRFGICHASVRGTLLHAAVLSENRATVVAVLEDFGSYVNVTDSHGHTPLYLASVYRRSRRDGARRSETGVVELLLQVRADPDSHSGLRGKVQAQTSCSDFFNPCTALVQACRRRDVGMVTTLLRHGADVHNCQAGGSGEGATPVSAAVCLDVLEENSGRYIDDAEDRIRLVEALVAARADVDGLAPEAKALGVGRTALHMAVRDESTGVLAAALLQARASVNISDACSDSPLHAACTYGHVRCARLLLEARADVTARDMDGKTPRDVVLKMPGRCTIRDMIDIEKLMGVKELDGFFCR